MAISYIDKEVAGENNLIC